MLNEFGDEALTAENWKAAVNSAVQELPDDIASSLGCREMDAETLKITVAGEASDSDDDETTMLEISVKYWSSLRAMGWPSEWDRDYAPGGMHADKAGWPLVNITGEDGVGQPDWSYFVGRATSGDLRCGVQLAVLEHMFDGGLISKDDEDRYIRFDGTSILEWQFQKKS